MGKDKRMQTDTAKMRRLAEERLNSGNPGNSISPSNTDQLKLVQELQVHQIELEMQNEELHAQKEKTEVLLEKYSDLYEFAPVGYCPINVV